MNEDRPPNGPARLSWLARLARMFRREPDENEQLLELLRSAHQQNLFDADALGMLEGVLQVDDMQVRDIMIPRSQVVFLERDANPDVLLRTVVESGHSRFPVTGDERNDVVGILLAKDLLLYAFERSEGRFNVKDILRPAIFVPESKRLNVLLKEFRSSRNHMAIVVDEYGGVEGLVTLEDVIEEVIGDIFDESDLPSEDLWQRPDGSVRAFGTAELHRVCRMLGIDKPADMEISTVGGLLSEALGRIPHPGDT
ncbi:MAG: CBS domain-containing protein, partial [Thiohalobacterales bacterium]|nr:CBS domain-containing protein [Thiohalobacterales bacterium]